MSVITATATADAAEAGWYDDPADEARERYWNGLVWTSHTRLSMAAGWGGSTRLAFLRQEENEWALRGGGIALLGAVLAVLSLVGFELVSPASLEGLAFYVTPPLVFTLAATPVLGTLAAAFSAVGLLRARRLGAGWTAAAGFLGGLALMSSPLAVITFGATVTDLSQLLPAIPLP